MQNVNNTGMFDTLRQLGGGVDLGKLIAKDNFPDEIASVWWSVASKVVAFGNLTPAEVENVWALLDNFEMASFVDSDEEALAEYDETYWDQVRLVTQSIVSLARDGTLLKTSMKEAGDENKGPGIGEKIGRLGGPQDPNAPSMTEKLGRWRQ
jgi:hypothetical protein